MIKRAMMAGIWAVLLCLAMGSSVLASTLITDSESDFSGTQGANGWYYGYTTDGATFTQFTSYTVWGSPYNYFWYGTDNGFDWTCLGADWTAPGSSGYSAVRRWVSTTSGSVDIAVDFSRLQVDSSSDGVVGCVYVDGDKRWEQAAAGDDGTVYQTTLTDISLTVGSIVDFVLYPNVTGDLDMTRFTATISTPPDTVAPVFDPVGPKIMGETVVTISSETQGAVIYYTTDGSDPTTSGTQYSNPTTVTVNVGTTLNAIAVASDTSRVTSQTYSSACVLADSEDDFSSTQGDNGWYYGYFTEAPWEAYIIYPWESPDTTPFAEMFAYATIESPDAGGRTNVWYGTPDFDWAGIAVDWMVPGGSGYSAVRRWISTVSGTVNIDVNFVRLELDNTYYYEDGVLGFVYVDGVKVWEQYGGPDDGTVYQTTLSEIDLNVGSTVDFILYPRNYGNMDKTEFTARISLVTCAPEISPSGQYISGPTDVTLSSRTDGASIYFTLNGGTPTTSSELYITGSTITVAEGDTLQAIAVADGYFDSAITNVTFEYNPARAELTRGHYLLVERGLQVQALTFPEAGDEIIFSMDRFYESNFTGVNFWALYLDSDWFGDEPAPQWARWCATNHAGNTLNGTELAYLDQMVSFQYLDEQDISNSDNVAAAADWFALNKERYPDVISHANQWGGQNTLNQLKNFIESAQPDMVMFDTYPFEGDDETGGSPTDLYSHMQKYRLAGLAGLDGLGNEPIPYALYLQTYVRNNHTVSDSEMRLNQFAAWAFGFKFAESFLYVNPDDGLQSVFFDGIGDSTPTAAFYEIAETNRQSLNLGPALVRLLSTDVRMIMGQHEETILFVTQTETNDTPDDITTGVAAADDYLTGVSATNLGSKNDGKRGDVIVGFFKPLHESFDGDQYNDQVYFMVTNGLSDKSGTALETRQQITVNFDFGSSGITGLQRLRRSDGTVENISVGGTYDGLVWQHLGGTSYQLVLTIDGGTGDLLKYNTGAPFVGFYEEVEPIPGDANLDGAVDVGDLGILAANYGTASGATWAQGDFTGDGAVDVGDLGVLAANYGTGSSSACDFEADYTKVFSSEAEFDDSTNDAEETTGTICSSLGLSLIAGLVLMGLLLVKLEE